MRSFSVGKQCGPAAERAEHHIVRQIHVPHKAHTEPVFRHEREYNALPADFQRVFSEDFIPAAIVFDIAD